LMQQYLAIKAGYPDLLLLRPATGTNPDDLNYLLANNLVDGQDPPASPKSFTLQLEPWNPSGNPNAFATGVTIGVELTTPGGKLMRNSRVVDGGSGRGSQRSRKMVFGLAGASTAQITVRWPNGQVQVFDAAAAPGFPNVKITNTADPNIIAGSISASYTPGSGNTTHTYTWRTLHNPENGVLQVLVDAGSKATQPCLLPLDGAAQLLLTSSTPGVNAEDPAEDTVNGGWIHTLTWNTYCSAPCTYKYKVRNVVGGLVHSSGWNTFIVGACAEVTQ